MANPKHVEILKQGVEVWNRWREDNSEVPDLHGADLHAIELSNALLYDTDLRDSILRRASLYRADLRGADLRGADLRGAYLNFANLGYAFFEGADLSDAKVIETDFGETVLGNANFLRVEMSSTLMCGVNLSRVKNLELVKHRGPSSIGIDTIYKSRGNIPENFLRGCGVPEAFIVQIPALVSAVQPVQFYSCFISYSNRDQEFAERLYADLQNKGVRCWFAPEDLKIGDRFRVRIDESIRLYDKLILILSENSVASEWVGDEVEAALEKEEGQGGKVVLFPLRLDGAVMEIKDGWPAKVRRTRHIGDFSDWKNHDSYKKAFERLMRDLKAGAEGGLLDGGGART